LFAAATALGAAIRYRILRHRDSLKHE
jgi:hypothetical protein